MTVMKLIEELLLTTELNNQQIVDAVKLQFPEAKTTTKSVSSVASVMRRFGLNVEKRKSANPSEKIAELELQIELLEEKLMRMACELADVEVYAGIEVMPIEKAA